MIARWSASTDQTLKDDGRVSMEEAEMDASDGTSLYYRENWPLVDDPERNESPETVVSARNSIGRPISSPRSPKLEQSLGESLSKRTTEDRPPAVLDDKDVSDLEDDSDDVSEDDELYAESRGSSPVVPGKQAPTVISPRPLPTSDDDSAPVQPASPTVREQRQQWRDTRASRETEHRSVSPILEDDATEGAHRLNGTESDASADQDSQSESLRPSQSDDDYERIEDSTPSPRPANSIAQSPSLRTISPQTNGRFTPQSTRQGSIMKSTPPSRSHSRRTPSITKNIPYDKSKVRYSWQSMQDEEPSRPRIHIIKLVSNTATASAGFPQGEAFGFSMSPHGSRLAAYNSARLYVLQTPALPVGISQDYALKRRPLAVEINDEGTMLAILMNEDTINVYDLSQQKLRRIRTIRTEFPSHSIALAPTGGLLAAGYEGGVEVFSLAFSAMETDRRSFRTQRIDRLTFSEDGSTLLGTTTRINVSHTMVITVPLFPAAANGIPTDEELKQAWIFDVHHPENIRNSSHSVFMRENRENCNERLFAWNGSDDTFGILNVGDMQYGNIDFPVVISPPLSTCGGLGAAVHSCPAIDEYGDTVAMVVNDRTIRLYIVPPRPEDEDTTVEAHSIDHELDEGYGCPFTEVRWVYNNASLPTQLGNQMNVHGRLLVTSPGGIVDPNYHEESIDDIEGGRIILFDFDPQFSGQPGQTYSLTLGQTSQPQLLEEPTIDVAEEISLVRRRTVNQHKNTALSQRPIALGRAATTFGGSRHERQLRSGSPALTQRSVRTSVYSIQSGQFEGGNRSLPDLMETNEALDTFEEPYAQGAPRSHASLQRAASNAQRHRFQTIEERSREHVSSDSSGNFLALPEYTEEPNAPLPSRFRAMAGLDTPAGPPATKPAVVTNINGDHVSPSPSTPSSAPAAVAENFSSEQAFRAAASSSRPQERRTETPSSPLSREDSATQQSFIPNPIARTDTFESVRSIPRGLQRAYGNAPTGPQSPSTSISGADRGETNSPVTQTPPRNFSSPTQNPSHRTPRSIPNADTVPEDEPLDYVGPLPPPDMSRFARTQPGPVPNRYSTSLLNPPGHPGHSEPSDPQGQISPMRAPSAASSYATTSSSPPRSISAPSSRQRRLPPHIQSFQRAAAAAYPEYGSEEQRETQTLSHNSNASASLFPPTQASDHVPFREPPANRAAGSVPHPVTAWHPPAPSTASAGPPGSSASYQAPASAYTPGYAASVSGYPARGHSRKSSLGNRSAFASTEKAKSLGFFRTGTRRRKKGQLYGPQFAESSAYGGKGAGVGADGSVLETKSIFTTFTRRGEGRCVVM